MLLIQLILKINLFHLNPGNISIWIFHNTQYATYLARVDVIKIGKFTFSSFDIFPYNLKDPDPRFFYIPDLDQKSFCTA